MEAKIDVFLAIEECSEYDEEKLMIFIPRMSRLVLIQEMVRRGITCKTLNKKRDIQHFITFVDIKFVISNNVNDELEKVNLGFNLPL